MTIQQAITVRHQVEGHVRFEIPKQLCDRDVARRIVAGVLNIEGVYKVDLFNRQRKLSIRFHETVCGFNQLAVLFHQLLVDLDEKDLLTVKVIHKNKARKKISWLRAKLKDNKVGRWVNEKYGDVKETVQAAKVVTKLSIRKPTLFVDNPEKAVINFFNDILVLYLIKLHWVRITQEWIPNPWAFRTQWTAVFYLFYLLMRSRRPK